MDYTDMVLRSFRDNEGALPNWDITEISGEPLVVYFVTRGVDDEGPFYRLGLERASGEIGFWEVCDDDPQDQGVDEMGQPAPLHWPTAPFGINIVPSGDDYTLDFMRFPPRTRP